MLTLNHNPDVLTCIANLSNDEVFTPPELAEIMLDQVADTWAKDHDGANIWEDPTVKFLDPCTKSGIFLREITRRLTEGLAGEIPNLQKRVNHILTKQVYGIAITNLTAMLTRRSVYCSKWASGEHSICTAFSDDTGNIWFERTEHTWAIKKRRSRKSVREDGGNSDQNKWYCTYCGAGEAYKRGDELETHAYAFIHTNDIQQSIEEIFGEPMHFDVIIGNPPYQLSDDGHGASATPIYQHFVRQCMDLDPELLSLVIPARWYSGGKGLDDFRKEMLPSRNFIALHDFPNTEEVFPGVNIRGGICYFLWGRNHFGDCEVTTHLAPFPDSTVSRPLLEDGVPRFIRFNEGVRIFRKVLEREADTDSSARPYASFEDLVSSRKPFGLATNFKGSNEPTSSSIAVYSRDGVVFCSPSDVVDSHGLVDKIKLFVPYASPGSDAYPHLVLSKPIIAQPGEIATETYLAIGPFSSESEARNAAQYMGTKFFRFMLNLLRSSQHVTRSVYKLVPLVPLDRQWTDDELAERYGLDSQDRQFIERYIKDVAWAGDFS